MSDPETRILAGNQEGDWLTLPGLKLTVVEGPDQGRETTARRGTVRVGSGADCDLVLTDGAVSRNHLELRLRSDDVTVKDLGSTNGTTIDGVRIMEAVVPPAALIRIGSTAIRATPMEEPVVIPLSTRESFGALLGKSPAMREVFSVLERVAPTDATVLVQGETGTGKELAAEAIHDHSNRADGPFIAVDCGAISANLMESEMFGHARGAFTGAVADRRGAFEEAEGGTLFLDEIGELPLDLQPKLLRALEKREVRRVGTTRPLKVDVRVVAATNRDLAEEVNRGRFREDLFFRLAVVRVQLPSLRKRREDVPMLVHHFIEHFTKGKSPLSSQVVTALAAKPWPGNVRELRNAIERAVAMTSDSAAPAEKLPSSVDPSTHATMEALFTMPIKDGIARWTEMYERAYLEHILHLSRGSVSGAAKLADVNRRYIQRLMKRHGIRSDPQADDEAGPEEG